MSSHLHATPGQVAARAALRTPMSTGLRRTVLGVSALLWLTGVLWLLAHFLFPAHNEFGALPNRWEAPLMRLHGLIAVTAVFLFGWIGAGHIVARWSAVANRVSGLWLLACACLLVLSGYALYYSTGALHETSGVLHDWLGVLAIVVALVHWLRVRRAR